MVIAAAGVWNHQEFAELVNYKLDSLNLIEGEVPVSKREKSVYLGGETRMLNTSSSTDIALAFQSGSWESGHFFVSKLL